MLHAAALSGNVVEVKRILDETATNINAKDYDNHEQTALHISSEGGFVDLVTFLIRGGASVNAKDKNMWTPLHSASNRGHYKIVNMLLKAGAAVGVLTESGTSCLHYLVRHEIRDDALMSSVMRQIHDSGSDLINRGNQNGEVPLHHAALYGKPKCVELLVANDANVNLQTKSGETPLHFAVRGRGGVDVVKALLRARADTTSVSDHGTPLEVAMGQNPKKEVIDLLKDTIDGDSTPSMDTLSHEMPYLGANLTGPKEILPRQRRVRHVRGISLRHFRPEGFDQLMDIFFTLHTAEEEHPFYTSEVVELTLNPSWRHFDPIEFSGIDKPAQSNCIVIKIWKMGNGIRCIMNEAHPKRDVMPSWKTTSSEIKKVEGKNFSNDNDDNREEIALSSTITYTSERSKNSWENSPPWFIESNTHQTVDESSIRGELIPIMVAQARIHLVWLSYIGDSLKNIPSFPPNSFVFDLSDGLYVPRKVIAYWKSNGTYIRPPRPPVVDKRKGFTCSYAAFEKIVTIKKDIIDVTAAVKKKHALIEEELKKRKNIMELRLQQSRIQANISRLLHTKRSIEHKQATMRRSLANRGYTMLTRARSLSRAHIAFLTRKQHLEEMKNELNGAKVYLNGLSGVLERVRWRLIFHLAEIYPIRGPRKCLTVCGIKLPNSDFTGCEEERVATALGYVCHMLYMISKYLEVPLRYPMRPQCSRSYIIDEITNHNTSVKFPLYSRGAERPKFEYAVFLLNKNMEQLLNSQGLDIITLRHTLPNLEYLISRGRSRTFTPSSDSTVPTSRRTSGKFLSLRRGSSKRGK